MRYVPACMAVLMLAGCGKPQPEGTVFVDGARWAFTEAADEVLHLRERAHEHPVSVRVSLVDEHGRETSAPVATLIWSKDDLQRVEWSDFSDGQLANLATVRIDGRHGVIAFAEWCGEFASLTPRLCGVERRRAEDDWASRRSPAG